MSGSKNVAASVAARLLSRARAQEEDYQFVLARYAIERLIWRLGRSQYAEAFVLKGAMMFLVWTGEVYRPTKDLDLLARASHTADRLKSVFEEICNVPVDDDGITFLAESIQVVQIREDQAYGGIRVTMRALIGKIRIPVQIDVGFGDAVTPDALECRFPALLQESESPVVLAYPRESSIAEKLEAIVSLGMANSRMKDYYDIYVLLKRFPFDGDLLSAAVFATFKRRQTAFPAELPLGLSDEFASDSTKLTQWKAFQKGKGFKMPPPELAEVVREIRNFVLPPLKAAAEGRPFLSRWDSQSRWPGSESPA
jgi:predicted nucleotidyltransferase component of viral defense system